METVTKSLIILLCVTMYDATRHKDGDPMFRCDYRYFKKANGWLNLHRIPDTWEGAKLQCQLEGAILASPITKELQTAMISLRADYINTTMYKSHDYSERIPNCIYTGFHATYSKKVFKSVEGVPFAHTTGHTRWAWGSPYSDVVGDADALVMGPELGLFGVNGKKEEYPFICYKKYENTPINRCSGTFDNQYFLYKNTGSCYKLHSDALWRPAYKICSAEGGHLVVINSDDEANHVKHILAKYGKHNWHYKLHVGFTRSPLDPELPLTIHGQTLEEAGYSNLNVTKGAAGMQCGGFYVQSLVYVGCDTWHAFMCEKKPGPSHCRPKPKLQKK